MNKEIIINVSSIETRIAITEDGVLTELFVEHEENVRSIGDIYLGKIAKVLPGIKAAFINVGHKQDAFLHFSDVGEKLEEYNSLIGDDSDVDTLEDDEEEKPTTSSEAQKPELEAPQIPRLEKGKDIIVQVIKEPVGNKGFRVTSRVSLPGRYLVLL
ncbi:MAG: ribonuclease E/G, partial [Ignavibacteria bacterium]|nr:ribonuclease E/G [Ignavibacteria bacterium]